MHERHTLRRTGSRLTGSHLTGSRLAGSRLAGPRRIRRILALWAVALVVWSVPAAAAQESEPTEPDFFDLSLEELMVVEVEVTSVTRQAQRVGDSAAAVTVITQEDIRRSGASSFAELLRLVPGVQVARINSNTWAVSARGFNDQIADKLLVLMDGRALYTPLFAGMFWDVQDYPLEDIERIEVIRGPGGSVWGANAVNGVINIISKSAHDTQGGLARLSYGTIERPQGELRYGATLDSGAAYRAYVRGFEREAFERPDGSSSEDDWDMLRAGFRLDSAPDEIQGWKVQGDIYGGDVGNEWNLASFTAPPVARTRTDGEVSGGNLLGQWTRTDEDGGSLRIKAYYDATRRDIGVFAEERDTLDFELLQSKQFGGGNRFTWGLGYRLSHSRIDQSAVIQFTQDERRDQLFSLFLHDEQDLGEDLTLIAGTKLEHNDYTGVEFQPNLRLLWSPTDDQKVWAAVSRAVATPSQVDHDVLFLQGVIPNGGGSNTLITAVGDDDLEAEDVITYELGYRSLISEQLSLELALFYSDYENLVTTEAGAPFAQGPDIFQPLTFDNLGRAETYGGELSLEWQVAQGWRMQAAYSYLQLDIDIDRRSNSTNLQPDEGRSPEHQAQLRSYHEVSKTTDVSAALYYVDRLPTDDISSYFRGDVVLEWRANQDFTFRLAGLGFFHGGEREFGATNFTSGSELEFGSYFELSWRF